MRQGFVSPEAARKFYGYDADGRREKRNGRMARERRPVVRGADAPLRDVRPHDRQALSGGEDRGGTKIYCSEGCLELYHDYVLVERGPDYRPPANIGETYADLMIK